MLDDIVITSLFFFLSPSFYLYLYFFFVYVGSYSDPFYVVNTQHPNSFHQTAVNLLKQIAFHSWNIERNINQLVLTTGLQYGPALSPIFYFTPMITMYNLTFHIKGQSKKKSFYNMFYNSGIITLSNDKKQ